MISLDDEIGSSNAILLELSIAATPAVPLSATSGGATGAYFEGNLTNTGGLDPTVLVYCRKTDQGTVQEHGNPSCSVPIKLVS